MNILLVTLLICLAPFAHSQEIERLDIEVHPQSSFPAIKLSIGTQSLEYYASAYSDDSASHLQYIDSKKKIQGEVGLSGYIFAKEFVESFRLPHTVANKKPSSEFIKFFSEKNTAQLINFIISVNERKRSAHSEEEFKLIETIIKQKKTQDDPATTAYFSTGYIELKSPLGNEERYFIRASDLNRHTVKIGPDHTKINILKALTVYSFQNALSGLNFGAIEQDSTEDKLFHKLDAINLSLCGTHCSTTPTTHLGKFAATIGQIVTFEVVGNEKIENFDDFNKYVLAQQWCLLKNFSNACNAKELSHAIDESAASNIISELLQKHGGSDKLCAFLRK